MKCKNCTACCKGFWKSSPDTYVCIGVKEPFEISDINTECTEYPEKNKSIETTQLIERLWKHHEDYGQGRVQNFFEVCYDCKQAGDKLSSLQCIVDDMYGDHYVDYLDFYANRCGELEEEVEHLQNTIKNYKKERQQIVELLTDAGSEGV